MRSQGLLSPRVGHQGGERLLGGRRGRRRPGRQAFERVRRGVPLRAAGLGAGLPGPLAVHAAVSSHQGRAGETLAARVADVGSLPGVGAHVTPQVPRANERLACTDMQRHYNNQQDFKIQEL